MYILLAGLMREARLALAFLRHGSALGQYTSIPAMARPPICLALCAGAVFLLYALFPQPMYAATSPNKESTATYTSKVSPPPPSDSLPKAKPYTAYATAGLPFGGMVHQDIVRSIARGTAYLEALRQAAHGLSSLTAAHIGAYDLPRRTALAAAVYNPTVETSIADGSQQASTTDEQQELLVMISLQGSARTLNARIRKNLPHPDVLALYEKALAQMSAAALEASDLVHRAALMRQNRGMHADEIFVRRISYLADQLDALWIYVRVLHGLRTTWDDPALAQGHMRRALTLAPQNPLLWCALGETQLQLDLPQQALESLNKAVSLDPDLARALYARGLAHFRMQQSALAENDLSAALHLQPNIIPWLRARGAVRMVREDYSLMCEDFETACALGDCDGLMAARKRFLCVPSATATADAPSSPDTLGTKDTPNAAQPSADLPPELQELLLTPLRDSFSPVKQASPHAAP